MDNVDNAEHTAEEESAIEKNAGYRVFSVVRSVFVYALALAILVAAFFFAADRSPTKSMFGYRYYIVLTDSMAPVFYSGDMVFVKLRDAAGINVGDIITFNPSSSSDAYLTHRVTEKIENYEGTGVTCFRTKGDANNTADSFLIDEDRVIGTVSVHVPKLGFVIRFVQLRWYFVIPLILLMIVFFRLMRYYFSLKEETNEENDTEQTPQTE